MSFGQKVTLPGIPGVTSFAGEEKTAMFDVHPIPEEDEVAENQFDASLSRLGALQFPEINPVASVKSRIVALELSAETQNKFDNLTFQSFNNLSNNMHSLEDMMRELVKNTHHEIEGKMNLLKKEYDHRFELQANENKRLQNHVSLLKADNSTLKHKLQSTIEKVRKLQHEFGDPDGDFEEESSILSSTGGLNATTSTLRPRTIG
jgi:hypothetical protein